MSRVAYVNGRYVRAEAAAVHIEDRGYQFGDGVYEVCLAAAGRFCDLPGHLARLERSLGALSIRPPMSMAALKMTMRTLLRRNKLKDALVYIQVTRGVAPRNHPFPIASIEPALVMTARHFDFAGSNAQAEKGVSVVTAPDIRWGRVDIKTINLLPNVLAKQAARDAGAAEAWLVRNNGEVTEGSSSNAWIVDQTGALVTHPLGHEILGGITRESLLLCAQKLQIKVIERPFTIEEAKSAPEAFLTSATNLVMPVTKIDDKLVGEGRPGPVATQLRGAYMAAAVDEEFAN